MKSSKNIIISSNLSFSSSNYNTRSNISFSLSAVFDIFIKYILHLYFYFTNDKNTMRRVIRGYIYINDNTRKVIIFTVIQETFVIFRG